MSYTRDRRSTAGPHSGDRRGLTTGLARFRVPFEAVASADEEGPVVSANVYFESAQAADLAMDSLALGLGTGDDVTRRGAGLRDDHVRLPAGVRAHVVGHPLGRKERVPKRALDLFLARELALELLHLVAEVGAFAPDLLEAVDDGTEELGGDPTVVTERPPAQLHVPDFDRGERHHGPASPPRPQFL